MNDSAEKLKELAPRVIGPYALFGEIAAGGMATVHLGRFVGPAGFSRTVAIKRLHPQFAKDPDFVAMFLDEARLVSRIQHPNVVSTLDVVMRDDELFLVMEYVQGQSLARLIQAVRKKNEMLPPAHVASILSGVLHGLHSAHEAKSEQREPLHIVHRDVSPQNVLVGVDGVARVLDFGVAKAAMRAQSTREGQVKGKLRYMAPEQLGQDDVDRRADVFAAGIVLWEALCGRRLFDGADPGRIVASVLNAEIPSPKSIRPELPDALAAAVLKGLERDIERRFQTAREFAIALEEAIPLPTARAVGEWVEGHAGPDLEEQSRLVSQVESVSTALQKLVKGGARGGSVPAPARDGAAKAAAAAPETAGAERRGEAPQPGAPHRGSTSPITDLSSLSVTAAGTPAALATPAARRRRLVLASAAGVGAAGALLLLLVQLSRDEPPGTAPAEERVQDHRAARDERAPPGESEAVAVEAPTLSVDELPLLRADAGAAAPDEPQPEEPIAEPASDPAEPIAEPPSDPAAPAAAPATKAAAPRVPSRRAAPRKADCDPPFTVDEKGIRRVKPECL